MPGKYTVRLTAAGVTLTKPVEVKADAGAGDLKPQFEMGLKLRELQSSTNDALRSLDGIREQINTVNKTLSPEAAKDLVNALRERLQQIASIEDKLARPGNIPGYSMGPRLIDRLSQLAGGLENTLSNPTGPQREHYRELLGEFNQEVDRVNRLLSEGVPQMNEMLKRQNAGTIATGKLVAKPAGVEP